MDEIQLRSYSRDIAAPPFYMSSYAPQKDFTVVWKDLTYIVERSFLDRAISRAMGNEMEQFKKVLDSVNGSFKSGQLTALMGPSGAGKSTLLECVIGKRHRGLTGDILCYDAPMNLTVAFIPQHDKFFDKLTVRESLHFVCNLKRGKIVESGAISVSDTVKDLMQQLRLEVCADNRITGISGGQQKRLSIAQELVTKPNILVLDEPTSGLDSSSCFLVVDLLNKLATADPSYKVAVVCTIHQPSFKVFSLFDKVIMMGKRGKPIYEGTVDGIVSTLADHSFECPQYYNPADFMIDVACEEYGQEDSIAELVELQESNFSDFYSTYCASLPPARLKDLLEMAEVSHAPVVHMKVLLIRSFMMTLRDPWLFWMRLASVTTLPIMLGLVYKTEVGAATGCFPRVSDNLTYERFEDFQITVKQDTIQTDANLGYIMFSVFFMMFSGVMPTVITFPMEMAAFLKEKSNNWYSVTTYFVAKSLAEIPFQVASVFIYVIICYYWIGEPTEAWRLTSFIFALILTSFTGQAQGLIVGAIFMSDIAAAVYIAPIICFPMMLLTGFFVKMNDVDLFWERAAYVSYLRHAFEASMVSLFGMERCGSPEDVEDNADKFGSGLSDLLFDIIHSSCGREESHTLFHFANGSHYQPGRTQDIAEATGRFVDSMLLNIGKDFINNHGEMQSSVMTSFSLVDGDLYRSMGCLFGYTIIVRFLAYFVVYFKANEKD